jgi:aspartyl-tRNA(Asn)/glutamyl-tRNA(Gln) amidotransferase subunit A
MQPADLTIDEASRQIAARNLSPVELTDAVLDRVADLDRSVGAFTTVLADQARAQAKLAEREIAAHGPRGRLHGIPVQVKDLYDIAGEPTLAGVTTRQAHRAQHDSTVVRRLREAGAIVFAKTHTHPLALGVTTPATRNPWQLDRTPGGSSGGTAAAIAAGMGPAGMGTDTAGSVRIPAALCGIVGLKPTYGRVSRNGIVPLAWSLDHAGPLARTVVDVAHLLNAVAGPDPDDHTSLDAAVPDYAAGLDGDVNRLRIGVPANYFFDACDPEVASAVHAAIRTLEHLGAEVREIDIPWAEQTYPVGLLINLAEASTYHRRRQTAQTAGLDEQVRTSLRAGDLIRAVDYIEAQRARTHIQRAWHSVLTDVEVILTPTVPAAATRHGRYSVSFPDGTEENATSAYTRFTFAANLTGLPALSMPCGFTSDGRPIGVQLIGRPLAERTLLRTGQAYERSTDWTSRRPQFHSGQT